MTVYELDSFYFKFKNLLLAEKNASLTLKSEAGRAEVTLSVDLGHLLLEAGPQKAQSGRHGPARKRRREVRAAARLQAEAGQASKSVEHADKELVTEKVKDDKKNEMAENAPKEGHKKVIEEVTDEVCSNKDYGEGPKHNEPGDETVEYNLECYDPGDNWKEQDVHNHVGESLEQMFCIFKVKSEDQQYKLIVQEKVKESFPLKLELKNFKKNEDVVNNIRTQGYVPGGGCVKLYRKYL